MDKPSKFAANVITILPHDTQGSVVSVTWLFPLNVYYQVETAFFDLFDTPEGVESVDVGRYSATVQVAPHVATVHQVIDDLYELLTDPPFMAFLVEQFGPDVRVQKFGRAERETLRRRGARPRA
jgi:hypothetical protein